MMTQKSQKGSREGANAQGDPVDAAIKFLMCHDFTEEQAKNILRSVGAKTPEQLMEAADRIIAYAAKLSSAWSCMCCIADGWVNVQFSEQGMMLSLTPAGVKAVAQLGKDTLPEVPEP